MNKILVITGPSAVGKTYLAQLLQQQFPGKFKEAKLYTTRSPRPNESGTDRVFVSRQEFNQLRQAGKFSVEGEFHSNWYGYPKELFTTSHQPLLINAWPALIPNFTHLPDVRMVGLTIDLQNLAVLKRRMQQRGDSAQHIAERLDIIVKDLKELEKQSDIVNQNGKIFLIRDDTTIPTEVLPWIRPQF